MVDDGIVAEVGRGLRARDAEVVDATDTIVMPGFVDAHRHSWTSLFRNLGERGGDTGRLTAEVRDHYTPDDVYAAVLVGLLGAAEAGITTVVDRCDLPLDDASADALLRAHADSGLRTVIVPASQEPVTRELLTRLIDGAGPSTTIAYGSEQTDLELLASDWGLARELGLRIHAHAATDAPGPGWVAALAERGLLGEDVTLIHHTALDDADIGAIAAAGASIVVHAVERDGHRARRATHPGVDGPRSQARVGDRSRARGPGRHVRPDARDDLVAARDRLRPQAHGQGLAPAPDEHARRDPLRDPRGRRSGGTPWRDGLPRARHAGGPDRAADRPSQHLADQRRDRRRRVGHGHLEHRPRARRRTDGAARRRHSRPTSRR